jgi:hypothetical protein
MFRQRRSDRLPPDARETSGVSRRRQSRISAATTLNRIRLPQLRGHCLSLDVAARPDSMIDISREVWCSEGCHRARTLYSSSFARATRKGALLLAVLSNGERRCTCRICTDLLIKVAVCMVPLYVSYAGSSAVVSEEDERNWHAPSDLHPCDAASAATIAAVIQKAGSSRCGSERVCLVKGRSLARWTEWRFGLREPQATAAASRPLALG